MRRHVRASLCAGSAARLWVSVAKLPSMAHSLYCLPSTA
jgi:hypothetical protein